MTTDPTAQPTATPEVLDLLVLGGTSWLGGAVARQAVEHGHRVTCLARGESGDPPPGVRWVRADRADVAAYDEVAGQEWDSVLDVTWQPDFARSALAALTQRARHWVCVSTCSVYSDDGMPDTDENAPLHPPHQGTGAVPIELYGPANVACEKACLSARDEHSTLVARPGLIAGYGDRSDRLGYWPARLARAAAGEPVLVPPRDTPVQVIDVEDLARWLLHTAEHRIGGVYNAVGDVTTFGAVLDASVAATGRTPELVEVSHGWLAEHGVAPWMGADSLPLWLPQPQYAGFMTRRNTAARTAGLDLRPITETVDASLRWERELGLDRGRRAGLTPGREAELLEAARDASSVQ